MGAPGPSGSPAVGSLEQADVSDDVVVTGEQPGEQPPSKSPNLTGDTSVIEASHPVPEVIESHFLDALEDSQYADSSLALETQDSLEGRLRLENTRFSKANEMSQGDEEAYTFASAPKFGNNHFSGRRPASMFHLQEAEAPAATRESNSRPQWRRPETSSPYSGPDLVPPATDHGRRPPGRLEAQHHVHPTVPSASRIEHRRITSKASHPSDENHREASQHAHIGDLALHGEITGKRSDDDGARHFRRGNKETAESRSQHRRPNSVPHHASATMDHASGLIPESGQWPINSRAKDDWHHHKSHERHRSHDHAADVPGSDCSSTRPASRVSNVSRRRRGPNLSESPSTQMKGNLRAIDAQKNNLREELKKMEERCKILEASQSKANERISCGKEQLKTTIEEWDKMKKVNEGLKIQASRLQKRIEVAEAESNTLRSREQQMAQELQASQATVEYVKGELTERCSKFRERLNEIMEEHQAVSIQSSQDCEEAVRACRKMDQQCQEREESLSRRLEATRMALDEAIQANREKQTEKQSQGWSSSHLSVQF